MTKKVRYILLAAVVCGLAVGCSGRYEGVPRSTMFAYQNEPTYGHLHDLATAYCDAINSALDADTLHPGMYAEYGVCLALMGHKGEACRMLNAEMQVFPQSKDLVNRIKQRLMPDMLADTIAGMRVRIDDAKLASWAYDSVRALQLLPYVPPIIDSTDSVRIAMQTPVDSVEYPIRLTANQKRELLAQQQAEAAMLRQVTADSIAAAKKAKIDQRKQAKADKRKAKKAEDKRKKKLAKERKRETAEKAKQRDKERQQAAEARKKGGKK